MANLVAGGMKSLNVHLEVPESTSSIIIEEYARTVDMKMIEFMHDPLIPEAEAVPTATLGDLPLEPQANA